MSADTAPAAMPTDDEIEAEIQPMTYDGADLTECVARVKALFAPVLAEKEREKAAALGLVQGHAAVIARLESRALAAEAALAAERERCAKVAVAEVERSAAILRPSELAVTVAAAIRAQGE